jgi:hypothetical protein
MKHLNSNMLISVAVMATGVTATRLLEHAWEAKTSEAAPKNPAAPGVGWGEALLWGATAGVLAGVAKTVARRGVSKL